MKDVSPAACQHPRALASRNPRVRTFSHVADNVSTLKGLRVFDRRCHKAGQATTLSHLWAAPFTPLQFQGKRDVWGGSASGLEEVAGQWIPW